MNRNGAARSVLFVGPLPEPLTGQSLACQVLVEELVRYHRVDVVNLSRGEGSHSRRSLAQVLHVLRIVLAVWGRNHRADLIYLTVSQSYLGNLKDLLIYLGCLPRLDRVVIHLYGGAGLRRIMLAKGNPFRWLNELFMRRLGGAIVEGPRQLPTFANVLPPDRLHVVPNFAEDHLFADPEAVHAKFNDTLPLRLLFLSNLLPGKGHRELVEAVRVFGGSQRFVLEIGGGTESDADREEFLRLIEASPQIRYHGVVRGAQKRDLFHRAHVFCLPTYYAYEGQPLSILEAYAAGCAVITTNHSGIRDVFAAGENGFEVSGQSVEALRTALEQTAEDPARLRGMALRNLAAAQQRYRVGHFTSRILPILSSVGRQDRG